MPATTVDTGLIRNAVQVACRAPSLYNSQPWSWVLDEDGVLGLFEDKSRVVHSSDQSGREALLSCGAALDHFRVAMAAAGWTVHADLFPNPNNLLHLASIDFSPMEFVTEGHRRRADAIMLRRTDRLPFAAPPSWPSVEAQLRRIVTADAVRLDVVPEELRGELAQASALTESLRLYDTSYHSELSWWTGHYDMSGGMADQSKEGVSDSSLVSAAESDRVDIGRSFPASGNTDRRADYGQDRSKILVLSTCDTERASVLACGEMLSAVLLDATMAGLATCTLTHITELPASRDIVSSLIGQTSTPQVLVRVGLAPALEDPPPATPRRPIDEVFEVRSSGH